MNLQKPSKPLTAPQTREMMIPGAHGDLQARLYASAATAEGLIVFFPPGRFVTGNLDEIDSFTRALATRTHCAVLASTYALAPARPFPAAAEDAHAVLAWATRHRIALGWKGTRLITAGIEAGGNLAAVSAMMARDRGGPALAAQVLIMPMLDSSLTSCSMRTLSGAAGIAAGYRGYLPRVADCAHPYASPLQSNRLKKLPPALILSAEQDPLRDEAEQYGAKLIAAGVKTLVKRLPPLLQQDDARCECICKDSVLREIAAFITGLDDYPTPSE